jgi:hypothetical protein
MLYVLGGPGVVHGPTRLQYMGVQPESEYPQALTTSQRKSRQKFCVKGSGRLNSDTVGDVT